MCVWRGSVLTHMITHMITHRMSKHVSLQIFLHISYTCPHMSNICPHMSYIFPHISTYFLHLSIFPRSFHICPTSFHIFLHISYIFQHMSCKYKLFQAMKRHVPSEIKASMSSSPRFAMQEPGSISLRRNHRSLTIGGWDWTHVLLGLTIYIYI